jgi:hypothetical protein
MMVTLTITTGKHKHGSIKLNKFSRQSIPAIKRGIEKAGFILAGRMLNNLSGPSHTRDPGNANPYPGKLSGNLARSVQRPKFVKQGMGVIVGPGGLAEKYAAAQEFGFRTKKGKWRPPPRPYVIPTWKQVGRKAINALVKEILRPLR